MLGREQDVQNITYRRKLSAVSTSIRGDDGISTASPRNCYSRNNVAPLRRRIADETDGNGMSSGTTPVEQRAAEIRRLNGIEKNNGPSTSLEAPPPPPVMEKKKSSSSLASVFRSRASSPIEKMRKFIGRSSSKQAKEQKATMPTAKETILSNELEIVRKELAELRTAFDEKKQTTDRSQQCDPVEVKDVSVLTDEVTDDKENADPDIICLENEKARIRELEQKVEELKKENAEKTEEFRQTRKDFILILKEAVLRKDLVEEKLKIVSANVLDDEDWATLMSEHRMNLRRNVLLEWAQKMLEPEKVAVSNFSSDWADCRAFVALVHSLLPDLFSEWSDSTLQEDCVDLCRQLFKELHIEFDEVALGIEAPHSESSADDVSSTFGLTDWRYVMHTVFEVYKRGVLRK